MQQFQCPHCSGMFQVDRSMAGGQASCPMCHGVVQISADAFQADKTTTAEPTAPPSGQQLSCPICAGLFQISPQMAGQEVLCPLCQARVTVPGGPAVADPFQSERSPSTQSSVSAYEPPSLPTQIPARENANPIDHFSDKPTTGETVASPVRSASSGDTVENPAAASEKPTTEPAFNPAPAVEQPKLPPRPRQTAEPAPAEPQTAIPASNEPPADQSTAEAAPIDPQQPVSTGGPTPPSPVSVDSTTARHDATADIDPQQAVSSAQTTTPADFAAPTEVAADVPVALDPDTGQPIQIHDAPLTVRRGDQVIELRRLSPKEKSRRRLIKNLIVIAICAGVIIGYLAVFVD